MDEYVSATLDFILDHGIRRQMNAFRKGFNAVFPIERLGSFAPEEVSYLLLFGQLYAQDFQIVIQYFNMFKVANYRFTKMFIIRSEQCYVEINAQCLLVRTSFGIQNPSLDTLVIPLHSSNSLMFLSISRPQKEKLSCNSQLAVQVFPQVNCNLFI